MTRHIVNIVPAFIPGDGIGNAARVRVAGLLERGYRVSVICATAKVGVSEFPGLTLLQAGAGWEADRSSLTAEMFASVQSADLLFVEFGCFNICHELLQNLSGPLILFYQGLTPATLMNSDMYSSCYWRAIGELRKMPQPSLVLAASQFTLDEYARITGTLECPAKVVPLFGHSQQRGEFSNKRQRDERLRVLTVGQLFPHKNYELLIDAAQLLTNEGIDIEVRHIGGASDLVARAYRENLINLAKSLGSRFQFLGRVEQSILDQNYRDAHVVVIPSLHEGYSLPAREALLHGKPVVASCFGALPETLQGAAEHFHPLDAHELASKLKQIASWSDEEWESACKRALDAASSHSKERYVEDCIEAIESIMNANVIDLDERHDNRTNDAFHESTSESAVHISGRIFIPLSNLDTQAVTLEACVVSDRHILQARMCAKVSWHQQDNGIECFYDVPLRDAEDWTSVYLRFVKVDSRERLLEIPGIRRDRKIAVANPNESSELRRLADSVAECYSPKSIVAADNRLMTRIKTHVANTILRLIYQVFIGPQMATMQSQLRLFSEEIRSLRAEIRILSEPSQSRSEDDELSVPQRTH